MWPFKNVDKQAEQMENYRVERIARIKALEDKFPRGSTFSYLGVECMVTHHWEPCTDYVTYDYSAWCPTPIMPIPGAKPNLRADYVDKNGVIRSLSLTYDEAMRLNEKA